MPLNYLFTSTGTSGNLAPMLTGARQLRDKGHHVRLVGDPWMRSEVEARGFSFTPWRRPPPDTDGDGVEFSTFEEWLQRVVFGPAKAYADDTLEEIARAPTDALVCRDLLFGCALAAHAASLPYAVFSSQISIRPLRGIPPASTGWPAPKTPEERARIDAASAWLVGLLDQFLPSLNEVCRALRIRPLRSWVDIIDEADRTILAVSRSFDFPAEHVPENFRYVGPLLDEPAWSHDWTPPWPATSVRPKVLITTSTGAQRQQPLFQKAIASLARMDIDAVATAGPSISLDLIRQPPNVQVVSSAPHDAVMPHVHAVVTQGGNGTVSRALLKGVPLLVIPNGRDQNDNAARVEAHGVGLRLGPQASQDQIIASLNRLLSEPHFTVAARRLGDAIRADIEACGFVQEMEDIVAAHVPARAGLAS